VSQIDTSIGGKKFPTEGPNDEKSAAALEILSLREGQFGRCIFDTHEDFSNVNFPSRDERDCFLRKPTCV